MARFHKTKAAIRLHTHLQADGSLPEFLNITDGKVHETNAVKTIPIPKDRYIAIDRGYHDFLQYNYYININIRFITKLKTNAKYRVIETLPTKDSTYVLKMIS